MISTANADGVPNVAPYSYYMPITGSPMLVAVSMGLRESDLQPKHTFENATRAGDFVINVTTQSFRDHIETAAIEFPRGVSEVDEVGWTVGPSVKVSSPSVLEAPAHLECRIHQLVPLGNEAVRWSQVTLVIAEVVCVALDESICTPEYRIDAPQLGLIGRMGFPWFTSATLESMFELPRYSYSDYAEQRKGPQ
jgi:flavin reductase (DIM6/NTAB) family NADH-FMN oxidoreductase RutF